MKGADAWSLMTELSFSAYDSGMENKWELEQIEVMRDEWEHLLQRQVNAAEGAKGLVQEWEEEFGKMTAEYFDLRDRGLWHRGPSDIFSILGRERRELYHSAMLAWLFDPLGPHGLGVGFLQAFLQESLPNCKLEQGSGSVEVRCEESRGDCRADVVVRADRFMVVIENKLDAVEGFEQCRRLHEAFCTDGDVRFVFLSPSGRLPKTAMGESANAFVALSYLKLRMCLERVLNDTSDSPRTIGRESAWNYLTTLKKEFA